MLMPFGALSHICFSSIREPSLRGDGKPGLTPMVRLQLPNRWRPFGFECAAASHSHFGCPNALLRNGCATMVEQP
jgi:hypothetical protein